MKYAKYTMGQVEAIFNILGGEEVVDGLLTQDLKVSICSIFEIPKLIDVSKQVVNYDRSIEELYKSGGCGHPSLKEKIKDENFPSNQVGEVEIEFGLFRLTKGVPVKFGIAELEKVGFRPATMKELLAFVEKIPQADRKLMIYSLCPSTKLKDWPFGCIEGDHLYLADLIHFFPGLDTWGRRRSEYYFLGVRSSF